MTSIAFLFDRVEDAAGFREPLRFDGGDGGHVFLGGDDEFVVDDIIGEESGAVKGGCRVQVTGESGSDVGIFAQGSTSGCLVEVAGADATTNNV